jgi:hypothetical protein
VGIPTDANASEERCFLRCSCRDVNRTSLEFSKSVEWSKLVGECVSQITAGARSL